MPVRTLLGLALLAAATVIACTSTNPDVGGDGAQTIEEATPDSVRDQVLAVVEQYYADFSAREWEYVRSHFWPGATVTTLSEPPGEPGERIVTTTIESFIQQAPEGPDSRAIFSETMTSARVRGNADLAQVWASFDARFGDPDSVQEWSGIDAFTLIRFENRWRISALAWVATTDGGPQ